jgi:hypothetical protein
MAARTQGYVDVFAMSFWVADAAGLAPAAAAVV